MNWLTVLGARSLKSQCLQGQASPWALGKNSSLSLPASSTDALLQSLSLSSCLCTFTWMFYHWIRIHPDPAWSHFNLLSLHKMLFTNKIKWTSSGRTWTLEYRMGLYWPPLPLRQGYISSAQLMNWESRPNRNYEAVSAPWLHTE